MARTLTTTDGNPASRLAAEYQNLMEIDCVDTLRARATALVVGGPGISQRNADSFRRTARKTTCVERLRAYLTNFMLKADGLGVI